MTEAIGTTTYPRSPVMSEEEVEKKINLAGFLGCIFGFICGAGLMTMVGVIF